MAFWADGFWAAGFWVDNFWEGLTQEQPQPIIVISGGLGGGGSIFGRRRKRPEEEVIRRNETDELLDRIQDTLAEAFVEVQKPKEGIDVQPGIDAALKQLLAQAEGYQDLSMRVAEIRAAVAEYERMKLQQQIAEDDEVLALIL